MEFLYYAKMSSKAYSPTRATPEAAGMDLKAAEAQLINPGERKLISTHLRIMIPPGHYGRIAPRSGLALHHTIDVCAGVIDSDYRGEIKILLHNHGTLPFQVNEGNKIAQLICEKITIPILAEINTLPSSIRGDNGFGSSDMPQLTRT
jgi:dUTP pyrophosphatase